MADWLARHASTDALDKLDPHPLALAGRATGRCLRADGHGVITMFGTEVSSKRLKPNQAVKGLRRRTALPQSRRLDARDDLVQRCLEYVQTFVQLFIRNCERHESADHVVMHTGPKNDQAFVASNPK